MTVAHLWLVSRWSIDLDVIFVISGDLCHALTIDKWVGSFFHKRNLHGKKFPTTFYLYVITVSRDKLTDGCRPTPLNNKMPLFDDKLVWCPFQGRLDRGT
jgi:hypothetical protein